MQDEAKQTRDGFEVVDVRTQEVVHFVPCDDDHPRSREQVLRGMLINMGENFFARDTREALNGGTDDLIAAERDV